MSLINQVLKDLDEREPLSANNGDNHYQPVNNGGDKPPTDWARLAAWIIVGVCVVGAGVYWFYLEQQAPAVVEYKPVQANLSGVSNKQVETQKKPQSEKQVKTIPVESKLIEANNAEIKPDKINSTEIRVTEVKPVEVKPLETKRVQVNAVDIEPVDTKPADTKPENNEVNYLPLKNTELSHQPVKVKPLSNKRKASATDKSSQVVKVKTALTPLQEARELLNSGRLTEAEQLLTTLVKKQPLEKQTRELLIGLLLRNSRTAEAEKQLSDALRIYPRHENFVLLKARLLLEKQDTNALLVLLENHSQSGKAGVKSLSMLASLYQQQKKFMLASKLYNRLAAAEPTNGSHWVGLAISLEALGQSQKALKGYQQAIQIGGINNQLQQYALQRINVLLQQVTDNE